MGAPAHLPLSTPERAGAASAGRTLAGPDAPCGTAHRQALARAALDEELLRHDPDQARARLPADVRVARASPVDLAPGASLLVASRSTPTASPSRCPAGGLKRAPLPRTCSSTRSRARRARARSRRAARRPLRADPAAAPRSRPRSPRCRRARPRDRRRARAAWRGERSGRGASHARGRRALLARFYPPADHADALPLRAGSVAVLRRRRRGGVRVPPRRPARRAALRAPAPTPARDGAPRRGARGAPRRSRRGRRRARSARQRQVMRLDDDRHREARRAVAAPRAPGASEAAPGACAASCSSSSGSRSSA